MDSGAALIREADYIEGFFVKKRKEATPVWGVCHWVLGAAALVILPHSGYAQDNPAVLQADAPSIAAAVPVQDTKQQAATPPAQLPVVSNDDESNAGLDNTSDATALPSDDGVNPRAPGLQLGAEETKNSDDPFAETATTVKSPEQVESEIRGRSYTAAVTGLMPLKTDEIRSLLETYDKTQQAVETPIYPYPDPQVVVQTVSLDPGVKPPEIKVATGHVSTVSILDITGAPWPIQDISWAGNFEIVQPEAGGAVMRITPMSEFAYGNMSVRLVGLSTPVTFMIKTHRDVVQYRFDARISQQGPGAKPPVMEGGGPQMVTHGLHLRPSRGGS